MHLPCCAATCDLQSRDRATPRCTSSRSTTRAPTGAIEVDYDEEFQIQKQSRTLWWTNANYHDEIKNDEEPVQNAMTVELEENDAVVTVLACFNYSQCQTMEDARSIVGQIGLRNIMDPLEAELIYESDKKMSVTVPACFNYYQGQTKEDDGTTAGM